MKKTILTPAVLLPALALTLGACSENYWNEHELDGFTENVLDPAVSQVETIEYTLTAADYSTLSSNKTNKALAEAAGVSQQLMAVGTQLYFTDAIKASEYVPALLSDPSFKYFVLTDGSAIKLTYNVAEAVPEAVTAVSNAKTYVVSDADYQYAWDSSDRYAAAFSPSVTAAKSLPGILADAYPDAEEGDMVVVNYQQSDLDPVFSAADEPVEPGFVMSNVIGTIEKGGEYTINGVVTATCNAGYILTDASGSVFVYMGSSFDSSTYAIGDQLVVNGTISSYNTGLQVTGSSAEVNMVGHQDYTYPTAQVFDGAEMDKVITRTADALAVYCSMTGVVAVNGNNINIKVAGAETAQGSVYYVPDQFKAQLTDGAEVAVEGYFIAVAGKRYCNVVVTAINNVNTKSIESRGEPTPVASKQLGAVWTFNGSRWVAASGYAVLNHSDYQAMGQRYDNLSGEGPETYLPMYMKHNYPYALAEDNLTVVYNYYTGSATVLRAVNMVYDGSEWAMFSGVTTETAQFVRTGGKWIYDPNVTITLPAGKGIEISTLYYQTCVDWVAENIDKPQGANYVTSYGNNEYYSGTSAYQGNVDLRPSAAIAQYAKGYEGMSNDEIVALLKKRFETESFPAALAKIHADAAPILGVEVIYTINFYAYNGSNTLPYVIRYRVSAPATFEFLDCTWND